MVLLDEKTDSGVNVSSERSYYNIDKVKERFKFPQIESKPNFFTFSRDFALIIYFGFRDKRFKQICNIAFKLKDKIVKDKSNGPQYVKNAFIDLGSTFIKIGQFLSSRKDFFFKRIY